MEYRVVRTDTGEVVFGSPTYAEGTNNIGEFLGIVAALAYCQARQLRWPVYSDSKTGISWVRQKRCRTTWRPPTDSAALGDAPSLQELIARAERWLRDTPGRRRLCKWKTDVWGEIPADYGRK